MSHNRLIYLSLETGSSEFELGLGLGLALPRITLTDSCPTPLLT